MSRELGVQFARDGIRVNALCPGPINTPLLQELFAKDPERAARRLVHVPMGRFGEPEEIAAAVAFLASDDSSFITASQFLVDGGITGAYVTPSLVMPAITDTTAGTARPVIGISAYSQNARWGSWDLPAVLLPRRYSEMVSRAGGLPVLLPPADGVARSAAPAGRPGAVGRR